MRSLAREGSFPVGVSPGRPSALVILLASLVQLYRWFGSPLKIAVLGDTARCRFTPSCSTYALTALQKHGARMGLTLTAKRLCRCHPWGGHGPDPVPESPQ